MREDLIFYTNPQSRGRIVRWMLEEVGVAYKTVVLDYGAGMKSVEYLAINPMGKVPVIVHNGNVVTEGAAICAYLAEVFPAAGLLPQTMKEKANYYRWLFFAAGPLESALTNKRVFAEEPDAEKERMLGYGNYEYTLSTLAMAVKANPFIAGERFTAADVYVGSHIGWGMQFGTLEKREAFVDYFARLQQRPALKRAAELDDALVEKASET
ncbi:glutathione S-transferase family protein [Microbulbifer spongiae]|uniref:Glutathione S-transferase family protein n=1 Tax=Microbulbifer spongiae TaxID=2944933 RepID=A0ABY9EBT3_9GAMM|nr:glutathione S-transferase family protein [Microbulbifer sp. MI-G]WKD49826.1 glutathione S-transferase family protein [Microbulbifer sp. MI-G]